MTRGSGTNDREKFTTTVTAPDLDTLNGRMQQLREHVEEWAEDFRTIQPDDRRRRSLIDDQSQLSEANHEPPFRLF